MIDQTDFYKNAAALIVAAAQSSGLLREVVDALCFIAKHPDPEASCRACAILAELADAFDEHIATPATVIESYYGEGFAAGAGSSAITRRRLVKKVRDAKMNFTQFKERECAGEINQHQRLAFPWRLAGF